MSSSHYLVDIIEDVTEIKIGELIYAWKKVRLKSK
jgi:hypothetical protein